MVRPNKKVKFDPDSEKDEGQQKPVVKNPRGRPKKVKDVTTVPARQRSPQPGPSRRNRRVTASGTDGEGVQRDAEISDQGSPVVASTDEVHSNNGETNAKPRGRQKNAVAMNGMKGAKKLKITRQNRHDRSSGQVFVCGQGDVGQLGLGDAIMERSRSCHVPMTSDDDSGAGDIMDVCAGGMHTVCLTQDGKVFTFGCNDEGALGRDTSVEGSECVPELVDIPGAKAIVQVTAGDSHTAALTEDGRVYVWGNFRDASGAMGLVSPGRKEEKPLCLDVSYEVVKISSGSDHLVLLTAEGNVLTLGTSEQGQLGRIAERFATRHGRKGMNAMLTPTPVQWTKARYAKQMFDDVWATSSGTFARVKDTNQIFATGLNNYNQLGLRGADVLFFPEPIPSFSKKKWIQIVGDIHHTLALDEAGQVHVLGRKEYGRLGLGKDIEDAHEPTIIPSLALVKCVDVACGTSTSYAVASDGVAYAWGSGSSNQLGTGDENDRWQPCRIAGKQIVNHKAVAISAGAQHFALVASRIT